MHPTADHFRYSQPLEESIVSDKQNQNTVLSADCVITGEIEMDGDLVIHGQVNGAVRVTGVLEITPTATVSGTMVAGAIQLSGQARANLIAEQGIALADNASVTGRLFTTRLSVAEGAAYEGDINVGPTAMQSAQQFLERGEQGPPEASTTDSPFVEDAPVQTDPSVIGRILNQRRSKVLSTASVFEQAAQQAEHHKAI